MLEFFTPESLLTGSIDKAARAYASPDQVLLPVDEALVNQLDHWRGEAMRHANWSSGIDESVQLLFSQLFILRAVEDRKFIRDIPSLNSTITSSGELDVCRLKVIFDFAKDKIQSELFDLRAASEISGFVIAGIIKELYQPSQLRILGASYDFRLIPADILGRAYEKYLSTVLVSTKRVEQQRQLFNEPKREVNRVSVRKAGGVYYTPEYITRYLASYVLREDRAGRGARSVTIPRFADITCGSGSFLTATLDLLLRQLRNIDPSKNWAQQIIDGRFLIGIDVDERAVTLARLAVWLRIAEEPNSLPLPGLSNCIVQGNALDEKLWRDLPEKYDIFVGNPPFLASGAFTNSPALQRQFETASGRFDYAFMFLEQAMRKLSYGGLLAMVTPNRLFTNRDAAGARSYLTSSANLLAAVDFGGLEVFAGISSYIGLIILRRIASESEQASICRVISVRELPPRFAGSLLAANTYASQSSENVYLSAFEAKHPRGPAAWVFLRAGEVQVRSKLSASASTLGEIAQCFQGIKTGDNNLFVVEPSSQSSGSLQLVTNRYGEEILLETELLRPVSFGTDIQRYALIGGAKLLLYPYRAGKALSESDLKSLYPRVFAYLDNYRSELEGRKSIVQTPGKA